MNWLVTLMAPFNPTVAHFLAGVSSVSDLERAIMDNCTKANIADTLIAENYQYNQTQLTRDPKPGFCTTLMRHATAKAGY